MRTIADAEDAIMAARTEADEIKEQFVTEWYKPMVDTMMAALWQQTPDTIKFELAKRVPANILKEFDKIYGGKK